MIVAPLGGGAAPTPADGPTPRGTQGPGEAQGAEAPSRIFTGIFTLVRLAPASRGPAPSQAARLGSTRPTLAVGGRAGQAARPRQVERLVYASESPDTALVPRALLCRFARRSDHTPGQSVRADATFAGRDGDPAHLRRIRGTKRRCRFSCDIRVSLMAWIFAD